LVNGLTLSGTYVSNSSLRSVVVVSVTVMATTPKLTYTVCANQIANATELPVRNASERRPYLIVSQMRSKRLEIRTNSRELDRVLLVRNVRKGRPTSQSHCAAISAQMTVTAAPNGIHAMPYHEFFSLCTLDNASMIASSLTSVNCDSTRSPALACERLIS
jgi:hypothetical protein